MLEQEQHDPGGQTTLRVCAAQVHCEPCDLDRNFATHVSAIREARARGADLVVFPELSLTGYHVEQNALTVAMSRNDPRILKLARECEGVSAVVGIVEEGPAAQFHNSAVVLRDGQIQFVHRKVNLASYGELEEDKYFAEGRYVDVFDLGHQWLASILICADLWNPALAHIAALYGATLLIAPVASSTSAVFGDFSNQKGWEMATEFYATIYGLPIVMCNHCGTVPGARFWGGSRILNAKGRTAADAGDQEQLIYADLDYNELREARFHLPTVRDSNLDLIHREIERMANRIGVPRGVRSM